jgi:hypothetical protein
MRKLKLNLGKETLTREQMKKVIGGGTDYTCWALSGYGSEGRNESWTFGNFDSCQQAQAAANELADGDDWRLAPWGFDCEC